MNQLFDGGYGLWELAVLSLLRERPMHPYEIQRVLEERRKGDVLVLKKGSLYHAIKRLDAIGLIEQGETTRDGRRPERTTYQITRTGKAALTDWLRRLLAVPQWERSHFMGAISFLVHITPAEAVEALRQRIQALELELTEMDASLELARQRVGRIHVIESEYARAMRAAELEWVRALSKDIRARRLEWDLEALLQVIRAAAKQKKKKRSEKS